MTALIMRMMAARSHQMKPLVQTMTEQMSSRFNHHTSNLFHHHTKIWLPQVYQNLAWIFHTCVTQMFMKIIVCVIPILFKIDHGPRILLVSKPLLYSQTNLTPFQLKLSPFWMVSMWTPLTGLFSYSKKPSSLVQFYLQILIPDVLN